MVPQVIARRALFMWRKDYLEISLENHTIVITLGRGENDVTGNFFSSKKILYGHYGLDAGT